MIHKTYWAVIDERDGTIAYSTESRELANQHINDFLSNDDEWLNETAKNWRLVELATVIKKEQQDCPYALPFRFCNGCKVSPCPIGLS